MTIHVVILAQGSQERMRGELGYPKQLIPLRPPDESLSYTTVIDRTIGLVGRHHVSCRDIVVVCDGALSDEVRRKWSEVRLFSLTDPGNSSLKGLRRYIDGTHGLEGFGVSNNERTVVLLGDVVYSWRCLANLITDAEPYQFVGTKDLSNNAGELWGVSWRREQWPFMDAQLTNALRSHPPKSVDDTYQAGQLRRWLWAVDTSMGIKGNDRWWYRACDDYTTDFDTPDDLKRRKETGMNAFMDDRRNNFSW